MGMMQRMQLRALFLLQADSSRVNIMKYTRVNGLSFVHFLKRWENMKMSKTNIVGLMILLSSILVTSGVEADPYADSASLSVGLCSHRGDPDDYDSGRAIGEWDGVSCSMGYGGILILVFSDNAVYADGDTNTIDLEIGTVGNNNDWAECFLSEDGSEYHSVAICGDFNNNCRVNIDGKEGITTGTNYHYLKIVDLGVSFQLKS